MGKMTIKECMDAAYQLMNQYSIAGTVVPLSYNDQADTQLRMINLINEAQMEIATTVKPIEEFFTFEAPELPNDAPMATIEQEMPEGFNHAIAIYFEPKHDRRLGFMPIDAGKYKWLGDETLVVPNRPAGTYKVLYNRFPEMYPADVDLETELDNKPDTHVIIPYFVAAMCIMDDNQKAYYGLYNVWETRLARLGYKPPHAVSTQVTDIYGFDNFGGIW